MCLSVETPALSCTNPLTLHPSGSLAFPSSSALAHAAQTRTWMLKELPLLIQFSGLSSLSTNTMRSGHSSPLNCSTMRRPPSKRVWHALSSA